MHTTATPAAPFTMGRLLITPGAQQTWVTAGIDPFELLARHVVGDWGAVCAEDWKANDAARRTEDRLLSAYIRSILNAPTGHGSGSSPKLTARLRPCYCRKHIELR